jgi:ubiquinone/menaquinone biosynthesis C-methylase UbiE
MANTLNQKLLREKLHGSTETAVQQAEYGWDSPAGKIRRDRRIEFCVSGIPANAQVLELGAGTGLQTAHLLGRFRSVIGIDISIDLLHVAGQRAPRAHYAVMDAHRLGFEDARFDAVLGISILHHLDWDIAIRECFRVLKPGGIARFSEPNLANPQIFLQKNIPWLKRRLGDSPDEYAFTRGRIIRSLQRTGFSAIQVKPFEFLHPGTPRRFIPAVLKLEAILSHTLINRIAGSLLIEARKEK